MDHGSKIIEFPMDGLKYQPLVFGDFQGDCNWRCHGWEGDIQHFCLCSDLKSLKHGKIP